MKSPSFLLQNVSDGRIASCDLRTSFGMLRKFSEVVKNDEKCEVDLCILFDYHRISVEFRQFDH